MTGWSANRLTWLLYLIKALSILWAWRVVGLVRACEWKNAKLMRMSCREHVKRRCVSYKYLILLLTSDTITQSFCDFYCVIYEACRVTCAVAAMARNCSAGNFFLYKRFTVDFFFKKILVYRILYVVTSRDPCIRQKM